MYCELYIYFAVQAFVVILLCVYVYAMQGYDMLQSVAYPGS